MESLTAPLFVLIAAALLVMMLVQGLRRSVELLSIRNLYLGGFIVYQLISPARVLWDGQGAMFRIEDVDRSGTTLLLYAIVFLPIYLFSYHKTVVWTWMARRVRAKPAASPDSLLMILALSLVAVSIVLKLSTSLPVIRSVAFHLSIGLSAVACGLVGWVWARRRANLGVILMGGLVFAGSLGIALEGSFGRRSLLAVGIGLAWGAFYGFGRRVSPAKLLMWSSPLVLAALVLVSAFSAIRGATREGNSSVQQVAQSMINSIFNPSRVQTGAKDVLGGQACGSAAMWCVENYPAPFKPRHLFTMQYMAYQFVPRSIWPDKPKPLANELARLANIKGVNVKKITLPPGVFGYAAAEGGLYALVIYAIFFGGFTRMFDEMVRINIDDPFFVTACGCVTGHFLGLARGDLANFTINIVVAFVSTLFVVWLVRLVIGRPVQARMMAVQPAAGPVSQHYGG